MIARARLLSLPLWLVGVATVTTGLAQSGEPLPNEDHWAFKPLAKVEPPAPGHPIDAFVRARLAVENLQPNTSADRRTLIRRLSFDLLGLPPTPREIADFLADPADDDTAVATLIERLLDSPHYGERWARHWLDVARFSESQGFERDKFRPHSWRYRDYVIDSLNADKPYDQFAREQIAGDVLKPVTAAGITATGFLVAGPWDEVGNSQQSEVMKRHVREEELEDIVGVVGQTFLGVTINCARCHDHKFDPIPATDYYAFKATFEGVRHGVRTTLPPDEAAANQIQVDELKAQLTKLEKQIASKSTAERVAERDRVRVRLDAILPQVYAATPKKPGPTHFLERGDIHSKKGVVAAAGLTGLTASLPADFDLATDAPEAARRRAFAAWMTSPENPLFARAIVNRVWHYHFGTGLVDTPNDLGVSGGQPSHPLLLDWLAGEFIRQSWSLKKLHAIILSSATWRQSSDSNPAALSIDTDNRLLWRFAPKRLEAEAVRDAMLAISGDLNPQLGGPSVQPYDLEISNSHFYHFKDGDQAEFNRRTIYRAQVASLRDALLDSLDCPSIGIKAPARGITATPVQALSLMNNTFVDRQCRKLAERLARECPDDVEAQCALAFQLALGRDPNPKEIEQAATTCRDHSLNEVCWALFNATEFIFVK